MFKDTANHITYMVHIQISNDTLGLLHWYMYSNDRRIITDVVEHVF